MFRFLRCDARPFPRFHAGEQQRKHPRNRVAHYLQRSERDGRETRAEGVLLQAHVQRPGVKGQSRQQIGAAGGGAPKRLTKRNTTCQQNAILPTGDTTRGKDRTALETRSTPKGLKGVN